MRKEFARGPLARAVVLGISMMGLAACGGGGGNVRSDPPPAEPQTPPPPPVTPPVMPAPVVTDTYAHRRVINNFSSTPDPGKGVVISVVSTGVRGDQAGLGDRLKQQFTYVDAQSNDLGVQDKAGVGTDLARVMATARVDSVDAGGLAYGAGIVSARLIPDAVGSGSLAEALAGPSRLQAMHGDLIGSNVSVMLNAWGGTSWTDAATTAAYVSAYRPFVVDHGGLVVFAAGDDARPQPSQLAALPSRSADAAVLEQGWLTVAALDTLNPTRLASYANACGDAARFCLVAPGDIAIASAGSLTGSPTRDVHGSAFAAAQVAAAAAALREKFPYMSAEQHRQILLGNAKDLGEPGVDSTFGWGLLDYDRSMRGPAKLQWGDFTAVIPAGTHSVWWNDMSGPGGVVVGSDDDAVDSINDASLTISGKNTFAGGLRIQSGLTVSVNGTMTAPITVDPGAYLYAWEVTLDGPVLNRGVMQVNSAKYINVETFIKGDVTNEGILLNRENANTTLVGNLFLKPSGTFMVNALGNEPLRVKGRIEVDGDLHIRGLAEGYVARNRTEVLVGEGGVTGRFVNVTSAPMIDATMGYDANTVWLDVARVDARAAPGVAYTEASMGAAQRVEHAFLQLDNVVMADPSANLQSAFAGAAGQLQRAANAEAVERSLDSLSGELHDADGAFAMMAIEGGRYALESRVDALGTGLGSGAWSQRLEGARNWSAYDIDTQGWMYGIDRAWNSGVTVGASLSETDGHAWHGQRYDRERNRQVDGQLYATWNLGDGGYLLGSAAFGYMQRWLQREVTLGAQSYRVSSDYADRYGVLSAQAGRRLRWGNTAVTPYFGAQAMQLDRDDFSEPGAEGFGLSAQATSMSAMQALAGVRLSHRGSGAAHRWELSGRIEWQRLLSQSGTQIQARFAGLDAWAPIVADGLDRDVGVLGLGLEAGVGRRSSVKFNVDGRYADGDQWMGAQATWTTGF